MELLRAIRYSGRMSLQQYRHFLIWYTVVFLPVLTFIFLAILILAFRTDSSILHQAVERDDFRMIYAAITIYVVAGFWPLSASTVRRLHDLNIKALGVFFIFNPIESFSVGRRLLNERGQSNANAFGENPGIHEPH